MSQTFNFKTPWQFPYEITLKFQTERKQCINKTGLWPPLHTTQTTQKNYFSLFSGKKQLNSTIFPDFQNSLTFADSVATLKYPQVFPKAPSPPAAKHWLVYNNETAFCLLYKSCPMFLTLVCSLQILQVHILSVQ